MAKDKFSIIRTVDYFRKSTDGETADGHRKQENSLPQQKLEVKKLEPADEKARYECVRDFEDAGVSGYKRGKKRPDYAEMLEYCEERKDVQCIRVDDIDRFSRATVDEMFTDVNRLRNAGVRWIHAVNQGLYDISDTGNFMEVFKLVYGAFSSHESSGKTGRRVCLVRRNLAGRGRRSGGRPPYGMEAVMLPNDDGNLKALGLKPGDPAKVKVVKRIFDEFVNQIASMNGIVARLNRDGIPAPRGDKWYVPSIKEILMQAAYRGALAYGRQNRGHFYTLDSAAKLVEARNQAPRPRNVANRGVIVQEGLYVPLVSPAIWEAAQTRLAGFTMKGSRRPREDGYPLSGGILRCDHCGGSMYGCQRKDGRRVYRCGTIGRAGSGACGCYEIREELILPFILRLLAEEIDGLSKLSPTFIDQLPDLQTERDGRHAELEAQAAALKLRIDNAREAVMFADARDRPFMDAKLKEAWAEYNRLQGALETTKAAPSGPTAEEQAELQARWAEYVKRTMSVTLPPAADARQFDMDAYNAAWGLDRRAVNEALHELGAEVRLRWRRGEEEMASGRIRGRNYLDRGRFRLGQRKGDLAGHVLASADC